MPSVRGRRGWNAILAVALGIGPFLSAAFVGGCVSPPPMADGVPPDGVIAVGVAVGSAIAGEIERHPEDWPVELRPGHAIILADGSLRADVGPTVRLEDRPGITRQLRRPQLAALWRDLDTLGLGDPTAGNHQGNPTLLEPGRREVIQVLECRRDGKDWLVVHRFVVPEAASESQAVADEDPRLRAAIRRIAALAWASDLSPESVPKYPERYDFGPDPWARYRRPTDPAS